MQRNVAAAEPMRFPAYLMRGETVELDGKFYVIPEPIACQSVRDLVVFLYDKGVKPLGDFSSQTAMRNPSVGYAG